MSGQNYIGSKISLISLSDIRYVGILHNINSLDCTVALQNVQSFGTEGRRANITKEIPASDNIFEYIVFRGSDIKDLQVFEAPPSYKPVELQDNNSNSMRPPSTTTNGYYNNNIQQQQYYPPTQTPAYGNYWQNNNSFIQQQQQQQFQSQQQIQPQQPQQHMRMPVPENYKNGNTSELQAEKSASIPTTAAAPAIEESKAPTSVISQEKQEVIVKKEDDKKEVVEEDEENIVDSLVKQVSDLDIKAPELSKVTQERIYKQQQQLQRSSITTTTTSTSTTIISASSSNTAARNGNRNSRSSNNNREATNHMRGGGGDRDRDRRRRSSGNNSRGIIVPRSDFDFASANAKFEKTEITAEENNEALLIPEPEQFYNKEKSFFDDISCESKEYKKGNRGGSGKYQEERKLNLETFGQANPNGTNNSGSKGGHRHHSGRGGRGRSYHRGGKKRESIA